MAEKLVFPFPEGLWAGSEQSLSLAIEANDSMMAGMFDRASAAPAEESKPYNYSLQGSIGVISIKGPLVNNSSDYNRYYGVTSYTDIRNALIYAANDPAAKEIVLHIDSGGGAVSGVADTGSLISRINDSVKTVSAFTDGMMASAAYWLGSSASKVYTSSTAIMGSIGVITTHKEYTKASKEAGIGVTVMRAGEYKALANSHEVLSEVAKKQMQDQLNSAYGVFISHVAENRGTSVNLADSNMGQGREFFGAGAVNAGLADGIETYDSLMSKITAKLLDSSRSQGNNSNNFGRGVDMKTLTEQDLAAIAAGAPALAVTTGAIAQVETTAPAVTPKVTESAVEANTPAAVVASAPSADVVAYLTTQLNSANLALAETKASLLVATAKAATSEANQVALSKIAAVSVSNMKVALGFSAVDASTLSPEMLLAEHGATQALFQAKFKAGGVAAVTTAEATTHADANVPSDWQDQLAAVRHAPAKK